ncbi:MAG: carboxypeptidase regulatory-like domain-containing protein, partial [Dehalococcoidia bacterium]|nr:carboxypeptidase regulatory-like domain-containing protein [Dehalococcoidia bacterium]
RATNYFFDVVPFHLYINPYNILNVGQWANSEMSKRGFGKSVWVNETNLPVYDDPNTRDGVFCPGWQGTQDEQASFVIQASALAVAASVDKVFLFQLYDDNVAYRENFGLVRNDNSVRPSYTAYQVAATYMSNPASIRRTQLENGDVESISFISPAYGKVTVLWNNGATQKTISLASSTPTAQLIDKAGNASWVTAVSNTFSVTLPPKAWYKIDGCTNRSSDQPGSPLILVEHVNADLSSKINPLPAITSQSTLPVSWTRLDTVGGSVTYDIQYRVGKDGTWQDWLTNTDQTSGAFGPAQGGKTYYFRSRAKMGEMMEPYPEGDGDAFTAVKLFLNGSIVDNRGWPVAQVTVAASTPGLSTVTTTTDGNGNYSLELPANGTYQVTISRQGFGALPPKSIGVTTSIDYDFALPPKNDAVQNGGFESGLAGWITSGTVVTQTFRHTGDWGSTISKTGAFSQTLTIPSSQAPTALSFFYRTPAPGLSDRLEVQVVGSKTVSFVFPLSLNTWQQGWVDTSGLQGKAEVLFRFTGQGDIWLDEVALGSSPYRIFLPLVDQKR